MVGWRGPIELISTILSIIDRRKPHFFNLNGANNIYEHVIYVEGVPFWHPNVPDEEARRVGLPEEVDAPLGTFTFSPLRRCLLSHAASLRRVNPGGTDR